MLKKFVECRQNLSEKMAFLPKRLHFSEEMTFHLLTAGKSSLYIVLCFYPLQNLDQIIKVSLACRQSSDIDQFNSILYFISHKAIQFILIFMLSIASISYTKCLIAFILIIHDMHEEYACLVKIGKELAVCHAPPLKCVDAQCSIAMLFIFM